VAEIIKNIPYIGAAAAVLKKLFLGFLAYHPATGFVFFL